MLQGIALPRWPSRSAVFEVVHDAWARWMHVICGGDPVNFVRASARAFVAGDLSSCSQLHSCRASFLGSQVHASNEGKVYQVDRSLDLQSKVVRIHDAVPQGGRHWQGYRVLEYSSTGTYGTRHNEYILPAVLEYQGILGTREQPNRGHEHNLGGLVSGDLTKMGRLTRHISGRRTNQCRYPKLYPYISISTNITATRSLRCLKSRRNYAGL